MDDQALAVARQLKTHGWQVKLACLEQAYIHSTNGVAIEVCPVDQIDEEALRTLDLPRADAVVAMLSDEENLRITQLVYEKFGIETMVVRLHDRKHFEQLHQLGALVVDPGTAMVSLLDQFVRSPTAVSLVLGMEPNQDMIDLEVRDRSLDGVMLRDLRLPLDTLILSIHREGQAIISHGYTRLKFGDKVTLVGSTASLDEATLRFDA
ncbi:MAG: potassium channel family protein [Anaerolineae bacterium]